MTAMFLTILESAASCLRKLHNFLSVASPASCAQRGSPLNALGEIAFVELLSFMCFEVRHTFVSTKVPSSFLMREM